jgi:hypothetical protein
MMRNTEVNKTEANPDTKELIGRCVGYAVADATCALARALHRYSDGAVEPAVKDFATNQMERLLNLYSRARVAGLTLGSFGETARYHGTIALRERLGSDASDKDLDEMISWPLELLERAITEDQKKLSDPLHLSASGPTPELDPGAD